MQEIKNDEINNFMTGGFDDLAEALTDDVKKGKADGGIIAKLPEQDKEIEINGLKFTVQQVTKSGNVILEPKGK